MKTIQHSSKGLTLIELMTVIAILVLSLLLAAPSISGYLENRKVRNVAESLFYGMQEAEGLAVTTSVKTEFTWTGQQWTVSQINTITEPPALRTPPVKMFDWAAGSTTCPSTGTTCTHNNWPSVSVVAVLPNNSTPSSATVTFQGGDGRLESPNPNGSSQPGITPPSCFNVTGRSGSRPLRVTVDAGGGVRVCDPQLPQTDPKGCKAVNPASFPALCTGVPS